MAGIKYEALRVLCSLFIVMALGAFLAIPVTAEPQESLDEATDMIHSIRKGPPLQDLKAQSRDRSGVDYNDDADDFHGKDDYHDVDKGVVEGDGGCEHIPGDRTTAGEGHLLASGLALCLPIYLLTNQFLL